MPESDINWIQLCLGYGLLLIPIAVFLIFKTGLTMTAFWAALRMTLQLLFIGFYLEVIFELDHIWLNLGWLVLMIGVAGFTVVKRAELNQKYFLVAVLLGVVAGLAVTLSFLLVFVLQLQNPLTARFLIPLAGMILGNCLNTSIVGMRSWHTGLGRDRELYCYYLACGATNNEALSPFIRQSLRDAFQPSVATMATIGLIALPGMMTGQILGGASPITAIKYQILIMICILTATVITVLTGILISKKTAFDPYGMLKH